MVLEGITFRIILPLLRHEEPLNDGNCSLKMAPLLKHADIKGLG